MKTTKKDLETKAQETALENAALLKQAKEMEAKIELLMQANQQLATMLLESNQRTTELFELINQHGFDHEQVLDGKYLLLAYTAKQYRCN